MYIIRKILSQTPTGQPLSCGTAPTLRLFNVFLPLQVNEMNMISFFLVKLVIMFNHIL